MLSERRLVDLREQLEQERDELRAELDELHNRQDRPSWEGDEADLAQMTMDREREMWRAEEIRDRLETVEGALKAIAEGSYGRCRSCGNEIDPARLKALPHATLCLKCKERAEEGSRSR